ncbi:uncharacterized protein LOC135686199 isoform X2 [Rhopilema esculentum]|uniref:uncharacterized protein LOC135686199 isoform X2 n=1 Tax=Rhopilema esculentum TaxID=499914 RepID=UPI0031D37B14
MHPLFWKIFLPLLTIISLQLNLHSASIKRPGTYRRRVKRGILSKTGLCPAMEVNNARKDNRLDYFGRALILPGHESTNCYESECSYDHECEADKKCCRNNCGALVCTVGVRPPHPCEMLRCPEETICKIERVRCRMPFCPDLYARSRPTCVEKPGSYAGIPIMDMPRDPGPNEVHFVPLQPTGDQPVPFSIP